MPNPFLFTPTTWGDYRIEIGPSVSPAMATGTYANNYLLPPTLVRSGPLSVPAAPVSGWELLTFGGLNCTV